MWQHIITNLRISLTLLGLLSILTGFIYPGFITAVAQGCFPWKANGSLIKKNTIVVGSHLIGQSFTEPHYFWGRLSATTPFPYNALASSGSNLGPLNPKLIDLIRLKVLELSPGAEHPFPIPVGLVTASGSGLDPEISPWSAVYQISRIANARHIPEKALQTLLEQHIQKRTLHLLGEFRVNVLQLNLALDAQFPHSGK